MGVTGSYQYIKMTILIYWGAHQNIQEVLNLQNKVYRVGTYVYSFAIEPS